MGVGDVVDELGGQQRLQQADECHREGVGGDDLQGVQVQRHVGDEQCRKAVRELALVADVGHAERSEEGEPGQGHNRDEGGRDDLGDRREPDHDGDADSDHRVDQPRHVDHVRNLGEEDQDRQGVDEADHDRARDEPHQAGDPGEAEHDLEDAREQHGGDEVVHAVVAGDRRDDQCDGAGRRGDHRGSATQEGDGDGHRERGEEPDAGVDAGDDRERDRLGDQGERDHQTGEDLGA